MGNPWLGSGRLAKPIGLVSGAALWSCGAASDRPPLDQQIRDAIADGEPGALDGDGADGDGSGPPALSREAALAATWQELGVPAASNGPDLASTPSGWFALSQRTVGDARAPSAWESHL